MRNFTSILLTFSVTAFLSCNNNSNKPLLNESDSLIIPSDSNTLYLPIPSQSIYSSDKNQLVDRKWYDSTTVHGSSYRLFKIKEPILRNYCGKKNIYRFTWSRTFDTPICVRIENDNEKILLTLKVLKGQGGYSIPETEKDTTINLPMENWDTFISLVDKAEFWNMPNNSYNLGFDGATWLLEGVEGKKYHWVYRWSPDKESTFGKACQYLISIAPIKIDPQKIY